MTRKKPRRFFEELREAVTEMIEFEQGKRHDLRVSVVPDPPKKLSPKEIRQVRKALHASQAMFARLMNVSANTVESWEQGVRKPQAAALKLLHIAKNYPEILLKVS